MKDTTTIKKTTKNALVLYVEMLPNIIIYTFYYRFFLKYKIISIYYFIIVSL